MQRVWVTLSVLAWAGVTSQAASAQDVPQRVQPIAPFERTVNWTGPYVGGSIAAVFSSARFTQPGSGIADTSLGTLSVNRPVYSVYGGFNYQVSPWLVLGGEYNHTWLTGITFPEEGPGFDFLQDARKIDALTARVGLLFTPDTMVYGKVGPARIGVRFFEAFSTTLESRTLRGIQGGVGVETMVTPNLTLRAEATYTRTEQLLSLNFDSAIFRPVFVMYSLGASYKFDSLAGWGVPAKASSTPFPPMDALLKLGKEPAEAPHWTGIEAGGLVSFNGNKIKFNDSVRGPPTDVGPFVSQDIGSGWFVGGNLQVQRVVVGAEATWNRESAQFNADVANGLTNPTFHFAKIDHIFYLTGRAGFLVTPETLLYARAGSAQVRMTTDSGFFESVFANNTGTKNFNGRVVGFGAETFVLPRLSVRVEGLYTKISDQVVFNGVVPNEFTLKPSLVSANLGVAYHF